MSTALEVRRSLDLTRAPNEQWNEEMVKVVAKNVFRGKDITQAQLYYCLNVAESLALNPMIGEVYFLPSKSKDGAGPAWAPYIGRNGLVKKANERGAYYESDTVHENDKFTMRRKQDGTMAVTHSYGSGERGAIVGAYAFLHFRNGDKPAFFYAKLDEYLPTFDQDWKMNASPWGNQRSAMIEKCAMIGAGRKRLDLGNVLIDAEGAIVAQMGDVGPRTAPPLPAQEVDFSQFTDDPELAAKLQAATEAADWPAAKCELVMAGRSREQLDAIADGLLLEAQANQARSGHVTDAESPPEAQEGDTSSGAELSAEGVTDADVVDPEEAERIDMLMARAAQLEQRMMAAPDGSEEQVAYSEELDTVQAELEALTNPDQTSLGL
jgi:hypothetical protein